MKVTRIKIENFRSIKSSEFNTSNFNIFVGQNNCGKTNFFEALEFFYNGVSKSTAINDLRFKRLPENEILVEVEFGDSQSGAAQMVNDANRTKIQTALNGADSVVFRRSGALPGKRIMFVNGTEVQPGTGFDAALNDFLPKFEYISTKQYYESVAKYAKTTPIGIMLSGVLATILQNDPQYQQFQAKFAELFENEDSQIKAQFEAVGDKVKMHLERQFPDTTKVKFEVSAPVFDDLLKSFSTSIDDGVETSAEEKGDGMQRALMLAIIQAYADFRKQNDDLGKSFLFFIDEAELHLHPTAQRNLKNVLHILSQETDQVFINTHSSVFVADNYDHQSIMKVEKVQGETEIVVTTEFEKPYIIFELLGGSPSDLLLPRNFLIVEGLSEFELLSRVIQRFYPDMPSIQILKANGDIEQVARSINAVEKVFAPLNGSIYANRLVILLDQPSQQTLGGVNAFRQANANLGVNQQIHVLPLRDIEQCYPDQECAIYGNWRKSQEQLDQVSEGGTKIITGKKKRQLAKHVGAHISQQQFETDLEVAHAALCRCWELAF